MRTLLRNARMWPNRHLTDAALIDGALSFPKTGEQSAYDAIHDLEGRIVVKGFADIHLHLDKALLSARLANKSGTLEEAVSSVRSYKAAMPAEDIRARAEKTLAMCRDNGTRFVRTHVDIDETIELRALDVLLEMRESRRDSALLQIVAFPQEGLRGKRNFELLEEALKRGADLVGGVPALDPEPAKHIARILDLPLKYGVRVDMHIDESDEPSSRCLELLSDMVIARGMHGRVTAAHCCSLAGMEPERVDAILRKAKEAQINIVSLPSTNLYLQGRKDRTRIRRGIPPLKRMLEHGLRIALASDNIQDPFNPFGAGSLPLLALIAGHGCHMGAADDFAVLLDMITVVPMTMMGIDPEWKPGAIADIVVLDAKTPMESIVGQRGVFMNFPSGTINR